MLSYNEGFFCGGVFLEFDWIWQTGHFPTYDRKCAISLLFVSLFITSSNVNMYVCVYIPLL